MIYAEVFPMDHQRRVKVCPYCGNTNFPNQTPDCPACGHSRRNLCLGKSGSLHENDGNARYCAICGNKTRFFADGLLKAWDAGDASSSVSAKEELPF